MSTTTKTAANPPFIAFCADNESAEVLKQFVVSNGWPETVVHPGNIDTAAQFLKNNHSPKVLFVDINSADTVPASLDALADVCDPGTKVIVSGRVNEYSFYCWLVEVGISSYLLKPLTVPALEAAYKKASVSATPATSQEEIKKSAKIIAVVGSRGGVGTTTVSVNIGWILANQMHKKTALLDFDPQFGTVALSLDLEPVRGLREALEKPERIDGLFIDRVMAKVDDYLSILSTEEPLEDNIVIGATAAENLFKLCRAKYSHIVVDLPHNLSSFTRYAITHADYLVCVTDYTIAGLRESLRYLEYCRKVIKNKTPIFVANRVGVGGKHEMPQDEFEKGLGAKISYNIPFVLDAYAAATAGEVLAQTASHTSAVKVLTSLSHQFADGASIVKKEESKIGGLLSMLKQKGGPR